MPKKRSCKRRKVRKGANGLPNKKDIEHNRKCERKYMLIDNPWMRKVLSNKKKPNSYLKKIITQRMKTLKIKNKKSRSKK
jgi:hypothetical protein